MQPLRYEACHDEAKPSSLPLLIGVFVGMYALYKLLIEEPAYGPYVYSSNPVMAMLASTFGQEEQLKAVQSVEELERIPATKNVVVHMNGCPACEKLLQMVRESQQNAYTVCTDSPGFKDIIAKMDVGPIEYVPQCFKRASDGSFVPIDREEVYRTSAVSGLLAAQKKPSGTKTAEEDSLTFHTLHTGPVGAEVVDGLYR